MKKRVLHKIPDSGLYWALPGGNDRKLEPDPKMDSEVLDIEDVEEEDEEDETERSI